ncbi:MAG: phosphatase [Cytophagales bacterium]|nr:MAG: phosphatase [Cytophagales bacterium]
MKLGAIDIGSNAIRFQITNVIDYNGVITFKKVEYVRFPLRLGQDVFKYSRIMEASETKFVKLMATFKMFLDLYEVDDYMFCATSAMRESVNGKQIAERVKKEVGVDIEIIDGDREAEIINKVIFKNLDERSYIHIDVGGGSTELNLIVGKEKIAAQSFKIGSVRRLGGDDSPKEWERMKEWVDKEVSIFMRPMIAIGTGGNISKLYELANLPKVKSEVAKINIHNIEEVRKELARHTLEERINLLMLNPDRADVILPACDIYMSVMKWASAKDIIVPDVGLKDGLLQLLYERQIKKSKSKREPLF